MRSSLRACLLTRNKVQENRVCADSKAGRGKGRKRSVGTDAELRNGFRCLIHHVQELARGIHLQHDRCSRRNGRRNKGCQRSIGADAELRDAAGATAYVRELSTRQNCNRLWRGSNCDRRGGERSEQTVSPDGKLPDVGAAT